MNDELLEPIKTGRLNLRCPCAHDAPGIARLMTPAISRWLASWPLPLTVEAAANKIAQAQTMVAEQRGLQFVIERKLDCALMGWVRVSLSESDPSGPTIARDHWAKAIWVKPV
jgi:ribosomal-protein-alanine N-acetyltransferase